ncbi:efflux RND transporter periplasmic adaptor subunit [Acidobacteriota bacterium]
MSNFGIRKSVFFFLFLSTVLSVSYQCGSSRNRKVDLKTFLVTQRSFSPVVTALGTVKPQVGAEVRMGARIPGKVEHLRANIGDFVKKGQVIAELEKAELNANVEKRKAELNRARANLSAEEVLGPLGIEKLEAERNRLSSIRDLDEREYERQKALFDDKLTSQKILDQSREEFLIAIKDLEVSSKGLQLATNKLEEDLKQLKADVESAQAAVKIAEAELSYATLQAPISGIIASVSTQEGETVAVGLSSPTFVTIIDLNRLHVETYVDEVDIGKIKIGQKASFSVEAFPSIDINGEVAAIYPKAILRENVVFYNVVVKTLNSQQVFLRPEMTANVSIFLESREEVLTVPVASVKKSEGINYVFLFEKGKPVRQEVQVGLKLGRFIEIITGLKEGDKVLENHSDWEERE